MRLDEKDEEDLSNVEDRREVVDDRPAASFTPGTKTTLGVGATVAIVAIIVVVALFSKPSPTGLVGPQKRTTGTTARPQGAARAAAEEGLKRTAVGSFNDAQRVFNGLLSHSPKRYRFAKLVLFWDKTTSGCGAAASSMGPFYCAADEKAYIDLGFYRDLSQRFGAPGKFAQAYVIAHEIGHHVQHLQGTMGKVRSLQARDTSRKSALSVGLELQADCYAGVWGHSAARRNLLDAGDIEAGLNAAAQLGDDTLRRAAGRAVSPETFSHGAAEDRERWFRRGLENGRLDACDTFK